MSGTKRQPIQLRVLTPITARAVDLYESMQRLRCTCPPLEPLMGEPCPGCKRWFDLHAELHTELGCKPWEWPCASRQGPSHAGDPYSNEDIERRMTMLKDAAQA